MATSTIKYNVTRGACTATSPFALLSWGSITYKKVGSIVIVNVYACTFSADASSNTPVITLPFTARGRQAVVAASSNRTPTLFFIGDGQNQIYTDGATAGGEYYFQFIIDTY